MILKNRFQEVQNMPEPASASVTAASVSATVLFVSLLGPQAGPWALIVVAAAGGGLWPLSGSKTRGDGEAFMLLLRCTLMAIFCTGMIANYLESAYGLPMSDWLAIVALVIGAMGNGWRAFFAGFSGLMGGAASVLLSRRDEDRGDKK